MEENNEKIWKYRRKERILTTTITKTNNLVK
jgi:hypothetical protein